MKAHEIPECPHCDTSCQPERINAERYICPVCSRIFIVPKVPSQE